MKYGLRKIQKYGKHYNYTWPLEVGAVAYAPDWNPEPVCGGGLHFCDPTDMNSNFLLLVGDYFAVIEYDETKAVSIHNGEKYKVETCRIVHLSESSEGIFEFFKDSLKNIPARFAFQWALVIGDKEHMRQFVTEPEWAYKWAKNIGDREYMRQFVTKPEWAYCWALFIGDKEHMRQFVTEPEWAYLWAKNIGDKEHMRQLIAESEWAHKYL